MIDIEQLRGLLARVAPAVAWDEVGPTDSLEEAGLDSLDKASFFLELETASGVKIPDDRYEAVDSLDAVLKTLAEG